MESSARVLIVDNDPDVCQDLIEILEPEGYEVQAADGIGRALLDEAERLAWHWRPHVVIIDLRLLGEYSDELTGLELAARLKSARCIIYSAHLTPEVMTEAFTRTGIVAAVGKQESPERLVRAVSTAAHQIRDWNINHSIQFADSLTPERIITLLFEEADGVPLDLANDTLYQLLHDHKKVILHSLVEEPDPTMLKARRRSIVLSAQRDNLVPVVVKLAPSKPIENEIRQYRTYVHGQLGGLFYAQLEGEPVNFWDLGAAMYNFLGAVTVSSFTQFYVQESDPDVILAPLRHFFTEVWNWHYRETWKPASSGLFALYDTVHHLEERLNTERRFPCRDAQRSFAGVPRPLANPVPWVLAHSDKIALDGIRTAVTHGDLHGDNLFVDREHAWVIDFERTGPGHILRDFVELEMDIIARLTPWGEDDLDLLYELAVAVCAPESPGDPLQPTARLTDTPKTRKALAVIAGLRQLAQEVTHYTHFKEYLWGLMLHTLYVASLSSLPDQRREHASLLSAVLCERLQQM